MTEEELHITINTDALQDMPLETLEMLERAGQGQIGAKEIIDLCDAFVVGGVRGGKFKIRHLRAIIEAINAALKDTVDPGGASAVAS